MHETESKNHRKKMIAPVIITGIVILYYAVFFGLLIRSLQNTWLKWLLGIFPILLAGTMIAVCIERIKEIKGGDGNSGPWETLARPNENVITAL